MSLLDRPALLGGLIAFLCLIWGSTWFAIKVGLEDIPPFFAAGVRYVSAAAIIAGLALAQGVRAPRGRRVHLALLALGLGAFGVSFGVVYWGEQYVPAGLAAVLFSTHPLIVSLVAARMLPDEELSLRKLLGVATGFVGVAVLMLDDVSLSAPRAPLAAAVVLVSPAVSAVANVSIKRFGTALHSYNLTALPMFYGGSALLLLSALGEDWGSVEWTPRAAASIAFLTTFGSTLAVVTYYTLLKRVSVSRLALISYLFPVVAVVLDVLLAGERFGARAWIGSALVVCGVAVAGIRRRAAVAPVGGARA
ncbi:MAG: DMT family transporter [Gemmatimonadota bacterium]